MTAANDEDDDHTDWPEHMYHAYDLIKAAEQALDKAEE